MNDFDLFSALLSQLFEEPAKVRAAACPVCGRTAPEIRDTGKLGCSECYNFFEFGDYLTRASGQSEHRGKIPLSAGAEAHKARNVAKLKTELADVIKEQRFERAAEIRDELKRLEG